MEEQMTVEFLNIYLGKLNEELAETKRENVFLKAKVAERESLLTRAITQLKEAQDVINDLKENQEIIINQEIGQEAKAEGYTETEANAEGHKKINAKTNSKVGGRKSSFDSGTRNSSG